MSGITKQCASQCFSAPNLTNYLHIIQMELKMKSLHFFVLSFLMVINAFVYSQNNIHINGRDYIRENNQWFIKDLESDNLFRLNELSMTVKLKEEAPIQALEALNKAHNITLSRENELGFIDLKISQGSIFHQKLNAYINSGLFESVEMNSYGNILEGNSIPNDPLFGNQYHWYNSMGWPHINAPAAWDIETGSTNPVTVAVLDLGVDSTNVDLNLSSIKWDFYDNDPHPQPLPNDRHGTGVAGVFGAKTNNGLMVSGISGGWTNNNLGSKIMALRVGSGEFIDASDVDDAIIFAANNGAKVINMSFWIDETHAVKSAIEFAYNQKGCLLVASAGNQINQTTLRFPARHSKVHSVGGITHVGSTTGEWLYYNNRGSDLDVVAPNVNIVSTANGIYGIYEFYGGTSFSSPQVAGVGALLFSKNTNLLHMDIRKVINQTAIYTPQMENDPTKFGNGLLQANRALYAIFQANGIIPDYPTQLTIINNNPVTLSWRTVQPTVKTTLESSFVSHYNIYRSESPNRFNFNKVGEVKHNGGSTYTTWVEQTYQLGIFFYRVTTVDSYGKESITSNEVLFNSGIEQKIGSNHQLKVVFDYNLEHNFPNPFNPSTTINYSIKEDGLVKLIIYNILGQEVRTLLNEFQNAGSYSIQFNSENLPSGVYLYKLHSGSYSKILKMIVTK